MRFADPPRINLLKSNVTIVLELCEKLQRMGERLFKVSKTGSFDLNFTFDEIFKELK